MTFQVFVLTISVLLTSSFPQVADIQPSCPENEGQFVYCDKQHNKCLRDSSEEKNCGSERCDCLKEIKVSGPHCEQQVNKICEESKKITDDFITTEKDIVELLEEKIMSTVKYSIQNLNNSCFSNSDHYSDLLNELSSNLTDSTSFAQKKVLPTVVFDYIIRTPNNSKECLAAIDRLAAVLKRIDQNTLSIIRIPFQYYHCGYHLGDFTRVFLRATHALVTSYTAIDFNQCCAAQRNCIFISKKKSSCDDEFSECTQNIVNSLRGKKSSAMEFKKILDELMKWEFTSAYRSTEQTETSYETYSEDIKEGFTGFGDSVESEKSIVYLLEPSGVFGNEYELATSQAYKYCENDQITISSCISSFIICNQINQNEVCFRKQSECLPETGRQNQKCKDAIKKIKMLSAPDGYYWSTIGEIAFQWMEKVFVVLYLIRLLIRLYKTVEQRYKNWRGAVENQRENLELL